MLGCPIVAPSANISGKLSITNLKDSIFEFSNAIDFAIDNGESKIGLESTIVRVIDEIPHILRPGSITPEQIKKVARTVVLEEDNTPILPSSDMKHYQLGVPSCLVYSNDNQKMIDKIIELSKAYSNPVILCCKENAISYSPHNVITIACKNDLESYSKKLFSCLRKSSSLSPDMILVEGVKKEGLGIAIMNRLQNVCELKHILD